MDIFSVTALAGGAAFFIFGMKVLSFALENTAGNKLKNALGKLTGSRLRGVLSGAVITAAVQSSSAVTVMLIGFAEAGLTTAESSAAVIMGSNIGTTSTAWLMCLSRQGGFSLPGADALIPLAAVVGIVLMTASKKPARQSAGAALLGLAVMMNGMEIMQKAAAPLSERRELFSAFKNPFISLIISALFTAAVQSSSASVGVLQALSASGAISLPSAMPIIAGLNIGTCVTAALASASLSKNARRVTAWHLMFNLTGSVLFMLLYLTLTAVGVRRSADPVGIAVLHTLFNVLSTAVLLPFAGRKNPP